LYAGRSTKTNLIKGQPDEIIPGRKWKHESQFSRLVAVGSDFQVALPQTNQQILNLVERLHGRRRIVNCRRQSPNGYVHKQPDRVLGILLKCALVAELNPRPQFPFINRLPRPIHSKYRHRLDECIADSYGHFDDSARRCRQLHQGGHIDSLYRARPSAMNQSLSASQTVEINRSLRSF